MSDVRPIKKRKKPAEMEWTLSANRNPTMVVGRLRVTVFQRGKRWRYVVSDRSGQGAAEFKTGFKTMEAAQKAGERVLARC